MRASFFMWMKLARRMQQRALSQPFPPADPAASSSGKVPYIRLVESGGQDLVQKSQLQERRGATDQLTRSSFSAPRRARIFSFPDSYISDTFTTKTKKCHIAFPSSWGRREGQINSVTCGGNSSSAVSTRKSMTRGISSGCRMTSSSPINSRGAADSGYCSWNLAFYSTAAVETETSHRAPCSLKQSDSVSNEEATGRRRVHMQESVRRESGKVPLADISYVSSVGEGSRDMEKEGKCSLSEERSQVSSDLVPSPEQGSSVKYATAASGSIVSSANATPMRFLRVNRPGSARRPGCSQASSSGMATCSSEKEHERLTEQPPQQHGKRNDQEGSGHASERTKTKEKDFCSAKNSENNEEPSSPRSRQIQGKEEEFGFKYKGPEPTLHGDWSHKGRVTDF